MAQRAFSRTGNFGQSARGVRLWELLAGTPSQRGAPLKRRSLFVLAALTYCIGLCALVPGAAGVADVARGDAMSLGLSVVLLAAGTVMAIGILMPVEPHLEVDAVERPVAAAASPHETPRPEGSEAEACLVRRMTHELRTPLNAIIGFSDLMQRELHGPLGDNRYKEYSDLIQASGQQLLQSTTTLLALTRLAAESEPVRLEWFEAGEVVAMAWARMAPVASRKSIAFDMAGDLGEIEADCETLVQALLSLFGELVAAGAERSRLCVRPSLEPHERLVVQLSPDAGGAQDQSRHAERPLSLAMAAKFLARSGYGLRVDEASGTHRRIVVVSAARASQ
ncbi:MAG: sensor histidine kinase [Hyphomicrobiaceae bacterium]